MVLESKLENLWIALKMLVWVMAQTPVLSIILTILFIAFVILLIGAYRGLAEHANRFRNLK